MLKDNIGDEALGNDNLQELIDSYQIAIEDYLGNLSKDVASIGSVVEGKVFRFNRSRIAAKTFRRFMKTTFKWSLRLSIGLFACIGLLFTAVYVGMHFGVFNVQGSITQRDSFYGNVPKITPVAPIVAAPSTATTTQVSTPSLNCSQSVSNCAWISSAEWTTINGGLIKDQNVINQVATETGVSARMIAATVVPEQMRFFTSQREVFEEYFQPLKILGSMSEFSLGIAGIKQQTASQIETYASNPDSVFYPGDGYSDLITYPSGKFSASLQFNRLTSNDHYYDYLYVAMFIKEIEAQWLKSGYDITQRPDVITTLFNIGFSHSIPKSDPEAGGSTITVGGDSYSFGQLGTLFYNSNQLTTQFPVDAN